MRRQNKRKEGPKGQCEAYALPRGYILASTTGALHSTNLGVLVDVPVTFRTPVFLFYSPVRSILVNVVVELLALAISLLIKSLAKTTGGKWKGLRFNLHHAGFLLRSYMGAKTGKYCSNASRSGGLFARATTAPVRDAGTTTLTQLRMLEHRNNSYSLCAALCSTAGRTDVGAMLWKLHRS